MKINKSQILKITGLAAFPWLLLASLLYYGGYPLHQFTLNPQGGDQLAYFRIIRDFVLKSFSFGKYGYFLDTEITAKIGSFGPHSPMYFMVYGLFGKMLGDWRPCDIVIANTLLLSVGFILLQTLLRLSFRQIVSLVGFFTFFFPFTQYYISGMMETFQYFLIIGYVSLLLWWVKTRINEAAILLAVWVLICSLCRITYIFLALPFFITFIFEKKKRYLACSTIYVLVLVTLWLVFTHNFVCPYPMGFLQKYLSLFSEKKALEGLYLQAKLIHSNLQAFHGGDTKEIYLQATSLAVIVSVLVQACKSKNITLWAVWTILAATSLSLLCFYDIRSWRGYRVLAPVFALAVVILICTANKKQAWVAVLTTVLFSILLPSYLKSSIRSHFQPVINPEELGSLLKPVFWSKTHDRWKNTLACDEFSHSLTYALPAGIGILCIASTNNLEKIKFPKYILLKKGSKNEERLQNYLLQNENSNYFLFSKN